ncbi:MAG: PIN domain-containing protein [Deferrisomatales bacterium]|nr:PIN domain-containing protein [Deferrisomatales bacterium]
MGPRALTGLLDSVILIDHLNGADAATKYLVARQGRLAVSVITRAEVLAGFEEAREEAGLRLLSCFPTFAITRPIADLAARLRRQHRWKMPDALQAAVCHHHRLRLVTRSTKDFRPDRHAFVEVPYELP